MGKKPRLASGNSKSWRQAQLAIRLAIWQWRFALIALAAGIAAMGVLQTLAPPEPPQVRVWFAARDLPVGTVLAEGDLREVKLPAQYAAGLVTEVGSILGRVAVTGLAANTPIWLSGVSNSDLGGVAPPGTVVVPLRFDAVTTSILMAGDRVNLVAVSSDGPAVIANSALVLPPRLEPTGSTGGIFSVGGSTVPVTLVAVNPNEAPEVASAAHLNLVTAILIP